MNSVSRPFVDKDHMARAEGMGIVIIGNWMIGEALLLPHITRRTVDPTIIVDNNIGWWEPVTFTYPIMFSLDDLPDNLRDEIISYKKW